MTRPSGKPGQQGFASDGIWLRPLGEADLEMTLAWRNREGVRQRFATTDLIAPEAHRAWFARYLGKADDLVFIASDSAGGPPLGQVAIYDIDAAAGQAEIGRFVVAPGYEGQGKMRKALQALVRFAREQLELGKLVLSVREDNHRAVRLYESLGFLERSREGGMIFMSLDLFS